MRYTRSSYASGVLPVIILSVGMLCDKIRQCTADILLPHERAIMLVCWHQQWLVGDVSFRLKFVLKVTHLLRNTPTLTDFRL